MSSETSKRRLEVTDHSDEISPKRAKPSEEAQPDVLPAKKCVTRPKPKLTVPYSPNLRTSSRLRNRVDATTTSENTKGKANKPIETQLSQHSKGLPDMYKSKTTLAVSPKLSTKARANARKTKQAAKSKKTKS
ncbi:hypothetical protein LOD99_7265 [Oopsacas minuta]|uniref:Uncharacterized protein n=1 Tax=Oopsacas minuta TaxID=111878 RepID=A0AAV7JTJ3_9METZ|nr:hypothetical protein LOD99_7265 [Oopsacas minuta]